MHIDYWASIVFMFRGIHVGPSHKTGIKLGATYIGTVIGAGFASGLENKRFFAAFGAYGYAGIGLAALLFTLYGTLLLDLSHRVAPRSYFDLLVGICGKKLATWVDPFLTIFMLGALCIMISGSGALFSQYFGLPFDIGSIVIGIVVAMSLTFGSRGVLNANSVLIPGLLFSVIFLYVLVVVNPRPIPGLAVGLTSFRALGATWPVAAILYVSYNILLAFGLFASLAGEVESLVAAMMGGLIGGIGLGLFAIIIQMTLIPYRSYLGYTEVPMLYIASHYGRIVAGLYAGALWIALLTTAIGNAFAFGTRMSGFCRCDKRVIGILVTFAMVLPARLGFARLVGTVYPFFGYMGLPLLMMVLWRWVADRIVILVVGARYKGAVIRDWRRRR